MEWEEVEVRWKDFLICYKRKCLKFLSLKSEDNFKWKLKWSCNILPFVYWIIDMVVIWNRKLISFRILFQLYFNVNRWNNYFFNKLEENVHLKFLKLLIILNSHVHDCFTWNGIFWTLRWMKLIQILIFFKNYFYSK